MEHQTNTNNVNDNDYKYSLNFMKYLIHGNILDRYKKDQLHNPESRTIKSFVEKMKKQEEKKQNTSAKEVAEGKKKKKTSPRTPPLPTKGGQNKIKAQTTMKHMRTHLKTHSFEGRFIFLFPPFSFLLFSPLHFPSFFPKDEMFSSRDPTLLRALSSLHWAHPLIRLFSLVPLPPYSLHCPQARTCLGPAAAPPTGLAPRFRSSALAFFTNCAASVPSTRCFCVSNFLRGPLPQA
jgi:hypothetical protein